MIQICFIGFLLYFVILFILKIFIKKYQLEIKSQSDNDLYKRFVFANSDVIEYLKQDKI